MAAEKTSVVSAAKTSVVSAAKKAATAATSAATSDISIPSTTPWRGRLRRDAEGLVLGPVLLLAVAGAVGDGLAARAAGDGDADGGDLAADGALEGRVAVAGVLGGGVDVGGDGEG